MSLDTRPVFYYGITITEANNKIDFNEGASDLVAILDTGAYSVEEFAVEVARALNEITLNNYVTSINRVTRQMTISADSNFTLKVASGVNSGTAAWLTMGFSGANRTGANTYQGNLGSGKEYTPQFLLQSYIDFEDFQGSAFTTVNKSASGQVEVVSFGSEQFMECNITFITDIDQKNSDVIETDLNAVDNVRQFLRYAITKGPIEFMPNKNDRAIFYKMILESTPDGRDGTSYKLKELYSKGLAGYYETGTLKFRKLI